MQQFCNRGLLMSVLALGLAGCSGGGDASLSGITTGNVTLLLADAPVDSVKNVNIQVTGVMLKPSLGEVKNFVYQKPLNINLLALQGGNTANLLLDQALPAGQYDWVRLALDVSKGSVLDQTGGEHPLNIPSGENNGLKLVRGFTVPNGGNVTFTLDFDVRKSLLLTGNGQYTLKPVLRMVENAAAGSIRGTVDIASLSQTHCLLSRPAEFQGAVYIFSGKERTPVDILGELGPLMVAPVRFEGGQYQYQALHVPAGDYTLAWSCGDDNPAAADTLDFVAGGQISVLAGQVSVRNVQ